MLEDAASRVVRVGDYFVAKYGPQTSRRIQEGQNMIFVQQNLTTPIPLIYALYVEDGIAYLLMEYVAGQSLESLWPNLEPQEQSIILNKLRKILDEMRSLPPPSPPFYGSVCHGPLPYFLFWTPETQPTINGPFNNEEELCLGLVERIRQIYADNTQHMARVNWFQKHLPTSLIGHPPTLTHGDLQKKNIIVTRTHLQNEDDDVELTILDWENAGWYPDYFEYFSCYTSFHWDSDWPLMVEVFLDPYPVETLSLMPVYHDIFM